MFPTTVPQLFLQPRNSFFMIPDDIKHENGSNFVTSASSLSCIIVGSGSKEFSRPRIYTVTRYPKHELQLWYENDDITTRTAICKTSSAVHEFKYICFAKYMQ